MSKSMHPDAIRSRQWREKNPDKKLAGRIRDAYKLLLRTGIIDGEKVLTDPTKKDF